MNDIFVYRIKIAHANGWLWVSFRHFKLKLQVFEDRDHGRQFVVNSELKHPLPQYLIIACLHHRVIVVFVQVLFDLRQKRVILVLMYFHFLVFSFHERWILLQDAEHYRIERVYLTRDDSVIVHRRGRKRSEHSVVYEDYCLQLC